MTQSNNLFMTLNLLAQASQLPLIGSLHAAFKVPDLIVSHCKIEHDAASCKRNQKLS